MDSPMAEGGDGVTLPRLNECYDSCRALRSEVSRWLAQSRRMDGPGPNGGGEDEANYALTWFPHYLVTGEEEVVAHMQSLLGALAQWVARECLHGYEPEAEAHHGSEPFLLFLPRYLGLFPEDTVAASLLEDAAHHIGNWVAGIPAWYDYERDCFYSFYLGTRVVSRDPRFAYEVAEHMRFLHIALAAYRSTRAERYLDWALRYGRKRTERILAAGDGPMPLLWDQAGRGLREADLRTDSQANLGASGHHVPGDPLAGIENLLASGAIYALGDLYALSRDALFQQAARRIVEPLVDQLLDPYGDPGAAAVGYYRRAFQDTSLDGRIRARLDQMPPEPAGRLAMVFPEEHRRREPGVGKRSDMVYWGIWSEDGSVQPIREPSTAALTLAYQISGDPCYAARALRGAATRLMMARRVLRGGREHADMGGAVCSVAAGHGRNWGQGAVTGCYGPLLLGTWEAQGATVPAIEVRDGAGRARLPEEVLSLVIPPVAGAGEAVFYNGGSEPVPLSWRGYGQAGGWQEIVLPAGASVRARFQDRRPTTPLWI